MEGRVRPVKLAEKLRRLTSGQSRARLAREAGLKPTAVTNYITRGSMPLADAALKLARAMNVPLDWLLDDDQDWPPPPAQSLAAATTLQLTEELGRRLLGVGSIMLARLDRAAATDWIATGEAILRHDPKDNLPKPLREALELVGQLNTLASELYRYDPGARLGADAAPELLRSFQPDYEVTLLDLWNRYRNREGWPGFKQVAELATFYMVPEAYRPPYFSEVFASAREGAATVLKLLRHEMGRMSQQRGSAGREGRASPLQEAAKQLADEQVSEAIRKAMGRRRKRKT